MPRAQHKSVLTAIAESAALTCRVSSSATSWPAPPQPAVKPCRQRTGLEPDGCDRHLELGDEAHQRVRLARNLRLAHHRASRVEDAHAAQLQRDVDADVVLHVRPSSIAPAPPSDDAAIMRDGPPDAYRRDGPLQHLLRAQRRPPLRSGRCGVAHPTVFPAPPPRRRRESREQEGEEEHRAKRRGSPGGASQGHGPGPGSGIGRASGGTGAAGHAGGRPGRRGAPGSGGSRASMPSSAPATTW